MALFTHKQKWTAANVKLAISVILGIAAMNLHWSQFSAVDGVQRIFLTSAQRCSENGPCFPVCLRCQCGSNVSGDATLGLMCCAVILAVFSRWALYMGGKGEDSWNTAGTVSMSLAFLCAIMSPVAWAVGCHANSTSVNAATSTVGFGPGFILSIVFAVSLFVLSVYYGRVTAVCGGSGITKSEASF